MVRLSADATGRLVVRDEQRIVTETVFATSLADDATRHVAELHCLRLDGVSSMHRGRAPIGSRGVNGDAVGSHSTGHVGTGLGVRDHQRGGATEARGTLVIRNIFDLGEQQRIIGLVVAVSTRPASRQNARSVTHHIDDET